MVDELGDHLAQLDDFDVPWGFDLDAVLRERTQQLPAAGETDDGTADTVGSSQGGAVDAPSAQAGRVRRIINSRHRPMTWRGPPRSLVVEGSAQAQRLLGAALRDRTGSDPGSEPTRGG